MAKRLSRRTVSITRNMRDDGIFEFPNIEYIESIINRKNPSAMVIVPYDNPTGQLIAQNQLESLAMLCVKHGMWLISDETYRELYYINKSPVSVWGLNGVPGIEGRRISIESASKIWNACGLRIGALVSDNKEFIEKVGLESTANVCPNVIGQYIFAALAKESKRNLKSWFEKQRRYYGKLISYTCLQIKANIPRVIISRPDASLYSVLDFKNVSSAFDASDFVNFCVKHGRVEYNGKYYTILMTPLANFYKNSKFGKSMVRLSYVDTPNKVKLIPVILKGLLSQYLSRD